MPCQFTVCRFSPQAWCRSAEDIRAVEPARLGGFCDVVGAGALVDGGAKGMLPGQCLLARGGRLFCIESFFLDPK